MSHLIKSINYMRNFKCKPKIMMDKKGEFSQILHNPDIKQDCSMAHLNNLFTYMRNFKCVYPKNFNGKSKIMITKKEEFSQILLNPDIKLDCSMACLVVILAYFEFTNIIIEKFSKDFFVIPDDGTPDKNLFIRILANKNIDDKYQLIYLKNIFLTDNILKHAVACEFYTNSWGFWILKIGKLEEPNDLILGEFSKDEIYYAFFIGETNEYKYHWLLASLETIKEKMRKDTLIDISNYQKTYKQTNCSIKKSFMGLLTCYLALLKQNNKEIEVKQCPEFNRNIPLGNKEITTPWFLNNLSIYYSNLTKCSSNTFKQTNFIAINE